MLEEPRTGVCRLVAKLQATAAPIEVTTAAAAVAAAVHWYPFFAHNLVKSLGGTQTSGASSDDEHVDLTVV